MVVRSRTGTFTHAESGTIPDQRCTASGKQNRRNIDVRQLALRAEDCTARARQLASALANALGRVFS